MQPCVLGTRARGEGALAAASLPTPPCRRPHRRKPCDPEIRNGSINFFPRPTELLHSPGPPSRLQLPPLARKGQMGGGIDPRPEPGPWPRRGRADQLTTRCPGAALAAGQWERAEPWLPGNADREGGAGPRGDGAEIAAINPAPVRMRGPRPGGMLQPAPSGHRSPRPEALNKLGKGFKGGAGAPRHPPPPPLLLPSIRIITMTAAHLHAALPACWTIALKISQHPAKVVGECPASSQRRTQGSDAPS